MVSTRDSDALFGRSFRIYSRCSRNLGSIPRDTCCDAFWRVAPLGSRQPSPAMQEAIGGDRRGGAGCRRNTGLLLYPPDACIPMHPERRPRRGICSMHACGRALDSGGAEHERRREEGIGKKDRHEMPLGFSATATFDYDCLRRVTARTPCPERRRLRQSSASRRANPASPRTLSRCGRRNEPSAVDPGRGRSSDRRRTSWPTLRMALQSFDPMDPSITLWTLLPSCRGPFSSGSTVSGGVGDDVVTDPREKRGMPWRRPYNDASSLQEKGQRAYEVCRSAHLRAVG